MYFTPLADVTAMPKHFGKTIKVYQYIPLLDDRNVNDQGIDAAGASIVSTDWFVTFPRAIMSIANASAAGAVTAINANVGTDTVAAAGANDSAGAGFATITLTGPLTTKYASSGQKDAVLALNLGASAQAGRGNLYGSSRDVGSISGRLPLLTENGGRVNRVGFTRLERSGSIIKFGFFTEFTQESFDFDTDEMLYEHLSREMVT
ncbi:N4-gp56 family major capsid protein, partial [Aphanothece microscopica]|uniref:N4-gp56 family major capsid protein n=1 Tax=Aphanothece microscopica TaxID=1049561 RepID=UPI00398504B6